MTSETRPPAHIRAAQLHALTRHIREQVYPYSPFYRPRLKAAGVTRKMSGEALLARLPLTGFDDVDDPGELVLRPDEHTIQRYGHPTLLLRVFAAKATNHFAKVNRNHIEPVYKPIHWHVDAGIPIGYTAVDVNRLAELGRRLLVRAELGRYDVVVGMVPAGPNLAYWELVLACSRAGLSTLHLNPVPTAAQLRALRPTVVAGRPADLERALTDVRLAGPGLPGLHTILVVGDPLDDRTRRSLRKLAPTASVVAAWAPPGCRSLWAECRGGHALHIEPDVELVEVIDPATGRVVAPGTPGELVSTGLGWMGSVLLRLRTGVHGLLEEGECPSCGRTGPRVRLAFPEPPAAVVNQPRFVRVLERTAGVVGWQAELRNVDGRDELIVFLALDVDGHPGGLLRALDRELQVAQFVVLDPAELADRIARHGNHRIVDLRAGTDAALR